ncbi:MAG: hypothetical protein AAF899_19605 [Pseudomonadota bacterium]
MISLIKTPFFSLFLFVLLLPVLLGVIILAPALHAGFAAIAALPEASEAAVWLSELSGGRVAVSPAVLAAIVVLLPSVMLTLFLVQRIAVWMVMPVGGGQGMSLPGDLMTWCWGFFSLRGLVGAMLGLLVAVPWLMEAWKLGVAKGDMVAVLTAPLGEVSTLSPFAPLMLIALAPMIGGMLALHGATLSLRAAGITQQMPGSPLQAVMQFLLAALAAPLTLLIVFVVITQDAVSGEILAWFPEARLAHVWAVALTAVIALQATYSALHVRAHLSAVMGRAVPHYLDQPSRSTLLDWADQQISDWRRQRLAV